MRIPCKHCAVPTDPRELHGGNCLACHADEAPSASEEAQEAARVACERAGLRMHRYPCGLDECSECRERSNPAPEARSVRYRMRHYSAEFGIEDSANLENYFRRSIPSPAWDRSTFGEMCQRIGEENNPNTDELPSGWRSSHDWSRPIPPLRTDPVRFYETEIDGHLVTVTVLPPVKGPLAPNNEIIRPHAGSGGGAAYDEGSIASYFDGRYRMRDVYHVLARLPKWAYGVLEARYAPNEELMVRGGWQKSFDKLAAVALMTKSLKAIRDQRAADDEVEWTTYEGDDEKTHDTKSQVTLRGTMLDVHRKANSSSVDADVRAGAASVLGRIRREAEQLVVDAETAYARKAQELST